MPEFHKSVQEAVDSAKKYARELIAQERAEVINELAMNLLLSSACRGEPMPVAQCFCLAKEFYEMARAEMNAATGDGSGQS